MHLCIEIYKLYSKLLLCSIFSFPQPFKFKLPSCRGCGNPHTVLRFPSIPDGKEVIGYCSSKTTASLFIMDFSEEPL